MDSNGTIVRECCVLGFTQCLWEIVSPYCIKRINQPLSIFNNGRVRVNWIK